MLNMLKIFKNQNTVISKVTVYLRGPCYERSFSFHCNSYAFAELDKLHELEGKNSQ